MPIALTQYATAGPENTWQFTVRLSGSTSELASIDHVVYLLDPSFTDPRRVVTDRASGFSLSDVTYGPFALRALAMATGGQSVELKQVIATGNRNGSSDLLTHLAAKLDEARERSAAARGLLGGTPSLSIVFLALTVLAAASLLVTLAWPSSPALASSPGRWPLISLRAMGLAAASGALGGVVGALQRLLAFRYAPQLPRQWPIWLAERYAVGALLGVGVLAAIGALVLDGTGGAGAQTIRAGALAALAGLVGFIAAPHSVLFGTTRAPARSMPSAINETSLPPTSTPEMPMPNPTNGQNPNILVTDLGQLSWGSPENVQSSLSTAYQYAEARAEETIRWYIHSKEPKKRSSRRLRLWSIALTTIGGLVPVLAATKFFTDWRDTMGQLGYVFLGLAAAAVALDKFFGYSTAWMRYIITEQALQKALSEFRIDWSMMIAKLEGKTPTTEQVQLLLQRIKEFVVFVDTKVESETQTWIAEFQTSLSEVDKRIKADSDASRPGAVDVSVTNGMEAPEGFVVALDGMILQRVHGTKYQIGYVAPGRHSVSIRADVEGKRVEASELVTVEPGAIAKATLALPIQVAQPA